MKRVNPPYELVELVGKTIRVELRLTASRVRKGLIHECVEDRDTLEGACAIASYILWEAITNQLGYAGGLVQGHFQERKPTPDPDNVIVPTYRHNHCWNIFSGYIIDITAMQFADYPEVHRARRTNWRYDPSRYDDHAINYLETNWYSGKHSIVNDAQVQDIVRYAAEVGARYAAKAFPQKKRRQGIQRRV